MKILIIFGVAGLCVVFSRGVAEAKDLGFKYNAAKNICVNGAGKVGSNPDEIGPCGDLRKHDFEKDKGDYDALGATQLLMAKGLDGALLQGQDLRKFNFLGSTMNGANLSGTDLRGAKFRSAEITKTVFKGAKFDEDTALPDGWNKETALKAGMLFISKTAPPNSTVTEGEAAKNLAPTPPHDSPDSKPPAPAPEAK